MNLITLMGWWPETKIASFRTFHSHFRAAARKSENKRIHPKSRFSQYVHPSVTISFCTVAQKRITYCIFIPMSWTPRIVFDIDWMLFEFFMNF